MSHFSPFEHPELLDRVVERLSAMADPARLRILNHLRANGECTVGALLPVTGLSQPSVSRHLDVLRRTGLVSTRRAANQVLCSIADESVFSVCSVLCEGVIRHARKNQEAMAAAVKQTPARRKTTGADAR